MNEEATHGAASVNFTCGHSSSSIGTQPSAACRLPCVLLVPGIANKREGDMIEKAAALTPFGIGAEDLWVGVQVVHPLHILHTPTAPRITRARDEHHILRSVLAWFWPRMQDKTATHPPSKPRHIGSQHPAALAHAPRRASRPPCRASRSVRRPMASGGRGCL